MPKAKTEYCKDFNKIRITLSKPTFTMLEDIKKRGCYRSYSHAIEETVRLVHSVIESPTLVAVQVGFERLKVKVGGA